MPTIELTDLELADAARGVRGLVRQSLDDAQRQPNPGIKALFERSAEAQEALVNKLEAARRAGSAR
jgi:single-stranded DNA-specific DHH superfamily exonuclease